MNKTELVAAMAERAGLSKTDAAKALAAYVDVVKEQLAKGDSISLIGFGTFSVVDRPARMARNLRTGAEVQVPAKKVAKFKASKGIL